MKPSKLVDPYQIQPNATPVVLNANAIYMLEETAGGTSSARPFST